MNLRFPDKDAGYADSQIRVYNTPDGNYSGEPETEQEVNLWGVTDTRQVRRLGMYKYAVSTHRALIHKFSTDFEYLMCAKGDWIKYAGDIALAGITQGRLASVVRDGNGYVVGFECDEEIPMESGKSYGMRVRKSDGSAAIYYLENFGTPSKTVTLSSVITDGSAPAEGDLFTFGEVKGADLDDAVDLIITDIQCGENLSAELTCVEYAPEIFDVDEDGFVLPDFENKISCASSAVETGLVTETWKTYFTYHDGEEEPLPADGDGTNDGWHHVKTAESVWLSTKTAKNIYEGKWSAPSCLRGLQGERGEKGDKGDTGADGKDGLNGADGKDGRDGGYQDYQFAVGDFGLTDSQARQLQWYDAPPDIPQGKCLYMATKWIEGE